MSTRSEDISGRFCHVMDELFPSATLNNRALELGVHANSLAKYLRGERLPSTDAFLSLIRWGVDVMWVLSGEGTPFIGGGEGRELRLRELLAKISDKALANEWERRLEDAITDGIALLTEVEASDLEPLAKKLRSGPLQRPKVSPDSMRLLVVSRRAYRAMDRVMWWFGDLDKTTQERFREFLAIHERVTANPSFRTLLYEPEAAPEIRSILASHDRQAERRQASSGENLGVAEWKPDDEAEPSSGQTAK